MKYIFATFHLYDACSRFLPPFLCCFLIYAVSLIRVNLTYFNQRTIYLAPKLILLRNALCCACNKEHDSLLINASAWFCRTSKYS